MVVTKEDIARLERENEKWRKIDDTVSHPVAWIVGVGLGIVIGNMGKKGKLGGVGSKAMGAYDGYKKFRE